MTLFLTSHIGGSIRKDGQRIPSSLITDNEFYALNDGSYIISENGVETLFGEAYRIKDGQISMVCRNNESVIL